MRRRTCRSASRIGRGSPPSVSRSHSTSTSFWVSQSTKSEMPCENVKDGPPFSAMNSCPAISNLADIIAPSGPGVVLRILESSKIDV